jgi:hypothetical protein
MNSIPVYFLLKQNQDHYVVYAQGIPVLGISDLHKFKIVRMYPSPQTDLTPQLVKLQTRWKERRRYRKWCSHPLRILYRELHGQFPR